MFPLSTKSVRGSDMSFSKQEPDLISIVMPIYNGEKHLDETLGSLACQTYAHFEAILVDDGSKDGTSGIAEAIASKDSRFKYVYQRNSGAGPARNHGLDIASGEYIIFLDSDDLFEPLMLERMHDTMVRDDSDVCICRADSFSGEYASAGNALFAPNSRLKQGCYRPEDFNGMFYQKVTSVPWDKMFRLAPIKFNGTRYQSLRYSNDNYFVLSTLSKAKRISFIDDILVHYRVGQGSSLRDKMYLDPLCDLQMLDKLRDDYFDEFGSEDTVLRGSLDSFTTDILFQSYTSLIKQSMAAAEQFAAELHRRYLPAWTGQSQKGILPISRKSKFKYWAITNVSLQGFTWALLPFDCKTVRQMGFHDSLYLALRLVLSNIVVRTDFKSEGAE